MYVMKKQTLKVSSFLLVIHIRRRVGHSQRHTRFYFSAEAEKAKNGEKEDYKGESKFASHLKAGTASSSFAKSRTLKEQREYLPAFACREDLLRTIRDNQGLPPRYLQLM